MAAAGEAYARAAALLDVAAAAAFRRRFGKADHGRL